MKKHFLKASSATLAKIGISIFYGKLSEKHY